MDQTPAKKEHPLAGLLLNIVIPVAILSFLGKERYLGPLWALVVAVAFPVGYGIRRIARERKVDPMSVIGLASVLLTGIFGLLRLPPEWIACKEAAIPFLIGLAVVVSLKTPFPLIRKLLLTDALFDLNVLHQALREAGNEARFERRLVGLSWGFAGAMFLSSGLSYALAKIVLKSEPGTEAYTAELGRMTGLSNVVVLIPVLAVMFIVFNALFNTLAELTGRKLDDLLAAHHRKDAPADPVGQAD